MEDLAGRVPKDWARRGGVIMPLYQAEAMWIAFIRDPRSYPCAIKIAAGKVNAVHRQRPANATTDGRRLQPQRVPLVRLLRRRS
jgi:hypothetical protein